MGKVIKSFLDFDNINLIIERLHINQQIDEWSDKIYSNILNSNETRHEFTDAPSGINISKLIINIKKLPTGISGQLDINDSKKTKSGWIININLVKNADLSILKHEMNHALRLTLIGKDKMVRNLNWIKAQNFLNINDEKIKYFFFLNYLADDEEINARVMETNGLIKETMMQWCVTKLSKKDFEYIIKSSVAYHYSQELIRFKSEDVFGHLSENEVNKILYIIESEKIELDKIWASKLPKIKMILKLIKSIFSNNTGYERDFNFKPKRNRKFYEFWIPKQGEKLKRRLWSLFDHYC